MLEELEVRQAAMAYLADRRSRRDGSVTRAELEAFHFRDEPLKLIDRGRGIRNPAQLLASLTILSQAGGPYEDTPTADGLLRYAYRARDPAGGDNRKLRLAGALGLPLILLQGIEAGVFVPTFPVYIVRDVPLGRYVEVAVDESLRFLAPEVTADQRSYAERLTRLRLHQPVFRARVLRAYETQCAICRLRQPGLLDAAHILPDTHPDGLPVVPNGLALCKIHHAAYDLDLVGIGPDLVISVSEQVLGQVDGPMLRHGLQEMAGASIVLPRERAAQPDRDRLAERFAQFRAAG